MLLKAKNIVDETIAPNNEVEEDKELDLHDIFLKFIKLVPAMYFSMEFISKTIQLIRYECTLCIKVPKLTLKAIQKLNNCLLKLYM